MVMKSMISAVEAEADAAQPSAHVQARILAEALPFICATTSRRSS